MHLAHNALMMDAGERTRVLTTYRVRPATGSHKSAYISVLTRYIKKLKAALKTRLNLE